MPSLPRPFWYLFSTEDGAAASHSGSGLSGGMLAVCLVYCQKKILGTWIKSAVAVDPIWGNLRQGRQVRQEDAILSPLFLDVGFLSVIEELTPRKRPQLS